MGFKDRIDCYSGSKTIACLSVFVLICLFVSSCASDIANRYYGNTRYPPKQPNQVEILRECPTRPYDVIADFQSRGETPEDMRRKAAEIGADAVIVATLGGLYSYGEEWAGSDSLSHTYTRITGTAIKYRN